MEQNVDSYPILIVEDDATYREYIQRNLKREGYQVTVVANGVEALDLLEDHFYPIIIADWMMPEMGGKELCRAIRSRTFEGYVFIMILSALGSTEDIIEGLKSGADEYLAKPFNAAEFIARLNTGKRVLELERSLKKASERIRFLSITDPLTQIYNRGYITQRFPEEMARARRYNRPLSVVMCDIDSFKQINDTHGHQVGDKVLIDFADCLKELVRPKVDWLVRYGGEEFLVFLPETNTAGAVQMAERARDSVENMKMKFDNKIVKITCSFGVAGVDRTPSKGITAEFLINHADRMLYEAKNGGRNQVKQSPPLEHIL